MMKSIRTPTLIPAAAEATLMNISSSLSKYRELRCGTGLVNTADRHRSWDRSPTVQVDLRERTLHGLLVTGITVSKVTPLVKCALHFKEWRAASPGSLRFTMSMLMGIRN
jgi:hypothetical protein